MTDDFLRCAEIFFQLELYNNQYFFTNTTGLRDFHDEDALRVL